MDTQNIKKNIKIILYSFAMFFIAGGLLLLLIIYYFSRDLPKVSILERYKPSLVTRVYDINGEVVGEFFEEKRILVPFRKIPKYLAYGVIATEDAHYYEHSGINIKGILRALLKDVISMEAVEGGSSITQQLVKNIFLTREKTIGRKIKEVLLSLQIEREYSKDEILELYLNHIYFGSGSYGVESASRVYFGKTVQDLTLAECAMLAGLPRAPYSYSPYHDMQKATIRRNWVLSRMFKMRYITKAQYDEAVASVIKLERLETRIDDAPYFNEYIRQFLIKKFGEDAVYKEGLKIYTTLDKKIQKAAEEQMKKCLEKTNIKVGAYKSKKFIQPIETILEQKKIKNKEEIVKKLKQGEPVDAKILKVTVKNADIDIGYGMKGQLTLESMQWAKKTLNMGSNEATRVRVTKVSDIIKKDDLVRVTLKEEKKGIFIYNLVQEQLVQGGLICIDAQSGYIKAMVGGYDFLATPFNRAVVANRQPGSAFKPFVYTMAIDSRKYTAASTIMDAPVSYLQFKTWKNRKLIDVLWKPENYHKIYFGEVTLRYALAKSLNIPTIKILESLNIDSVIDFANKAGLVSVNNKNLSLALGTSEVTLIDLTAAFGVFANQGIKVTPMAIRYIEGNNGNLLAQYTPRDTVVLSEDVSYIMANVLESVIKVGTAQRIKAIGRQISGKTGTTDRAVDAWFVGFTPEMVTGMYVGLDDRTSMGQHASGEEIVVPFWTEFMKEALKDIPPSTFPIPEGVVFADIDSNTGLLATSECQNIFTEVFLRGTEPTKKCNNHIEQDMMQNRMKITITPSEESAVEELPVE